MLPYRLIIALPAIIHPKIKQGNSSCLQLIKVEQNFFNCLVTQSFKAKFVDMFPDQTIKASLATHNPRAYPVISPEIRTSTTVVKSLGCSLLKASPGQRSFAMYMKEGFNTGKRPGVAEGHWINLRRVASHMCTIEEHAIKEFHGRYD